MANRYPQRMGKLPVVPYREPEPWVPSGGFEQFRTPEERELDAELAAQHAAEAEDADPTGEAEPADEEDGAGEPSAEG